MNQITARLLVLALVFGTAACAKKTPVAAGPAPRAEAPGADAERRAAEERALREADEARRRDELARAQSILASVVYFDYDSYEIRADSRAQLDDKIPVLRRNPDVQLRIVGHTDERGSVEYNIALGMRRAEAAKEYLVQYGLDPSRFGTISFGEEQPADEGAGEPFWSLNRRAEFQVTRGSVRGQ